MYPTGIQNSEPIVEATVSITRPDKDGILRTTTENVITDFDKLAKEYPSPNKL